MDGYRTSQRNGVTGSKWIWHKAVRRLGAGAAAQHRVGLVVHVSCFEKIA